MEVTRSALLAFVTQARRLGFTLGDIKEIISIKRSGRAPCPHVRRSGEPEGDRARQDAPLI